MKILSSIVMAIAILAGLVLAITPFVADYFFPVPENVVRQAKPEAAVMALQQWFKSPDELFTDVQAINEKNDKQAISWFSFSVGRRPVETYILDKKLTQEALTDEIMTARFFTNNPPATWWQPEAVNQETFFSGEDQGRSVSLIYNPKSKRGVLVTNSMLQ